MTIEDERIDERIRALPSPPLPPALAARVHEHARAAFKESAAPRRAASFATAAAVVSACAVYLAWAARFVSALAQG